MPGERAWAAGVHLAAPLTAALVVAVTGWPALWAVLAAPVGPAIVGLLARRRGAFARGHGDEALRFALSVATYGAAVALGLLLTARLPATAALWPVLLLAMLVVTVNWVVFAVLASVRAARGHRFDYPMAIRRRRVP